MRVCDRHHDIQAVDEIILKKTDTRYELCQDCMDKIAKFLGADLQEIEPTEPPKRKRMWPIKNSA